MKNEWQFGLDLIWIWFSATTSTAHRFFVMRFIHRDVGLVVKNYKLKRWITSMDGSHGCNPISADIIKSLSETFDKAMQNYRTLEIINNQLFLVYVRFYWVCIIHLCSICPSRCSSITRSVSRTPQDSDYGLRVVRW